MTFVIMLTLALPPNREHASTHHHQVFLQNCHLAKSWMDSMTFMIKGFALPDAPVHEDFRLFLSSMPCSFFPIGVLQVRLIRLIP